MKDDAVIKDNEAVYLLNEQTYLHLRENLEGVGYEVFDKNSPLPVEEGQIPREALGNTQRRIETARAYYLAEHQDEPVGKIQNVAVTTLEKFRSGVRKRRNLAPRSLPENDVRFIDPQYNELFRVPDGSVVQMTYPDGHQRSEKVEYLDDYHMKIGSSVQHICEFAERMARSRAIVEPEPLTQQEQRAWNLEYDYYLTVQAEGGAWEYALYQGDCCLLERGEIDTTYREKRYSMRSQFTSYEQLPITLTADHVAAALGISRANAYILLRSDGFPTLHIGKRMVVPKDRFLQWITDSVNS